MEDTSPRGERKKRGTPNAPDGMSQFSRHILSVLLIFMILSGTYSLIFDSTAGKTEVPLSKVATDVKSELVSEITVAGDNLTILLADKTTQTSHKEFDSSLSETLARYGVTPEQLAKVAIRIEDPSGAEYWLFNIILPTLVPVLFIVFFFWYMSRQMRGSSMQVFSFGQSRARIIDPNDQKQKVTFKDVAGVKEAKEELLEVVDFLKNPKKFLDIGARIPKGVLLVGPPGTGKTLLARAVAGEAGVPFMYLSGSEFVEMFVGVGASRTRDLFAMAKKVAPSIIFIDEIDAVGRHRGTGLGGGNDEREQTLNQILVEMDGFEQNEKVVVMAGTNRPDVLDPALLRPGRFDRRVILDLPDLKDRQAILEIHAKSKPLGEDVDLEVIAQRTPGFSGADLGNLMNEASILTAREDRNKVTQYDVIRSIEKVMLGPERKSHLLTAKEKEITAYHEMGHALLASVLPHADPVHKVTIISRGRAGGYTLKLPLEERKLQTKKEFLDDIAVALGGYVAELMVYGDVTTGPTNDIAVATALARDMVTKYGMSDAIGPVAFNEEVTNVMFGRGGSGEKAYSEDVSSRVDREVARIMSEARARAEATLLEHRKALDAMAQELSRIETLERKEFEELLVVNGIKPKRREVSA